MFEALMSDQSTVDASAWARNELRSVYRQLETVAGGLDVAGTSNNHVAAAMISIEDAIADLGRLENRHD